MKIEFLIHSLLISINLKNLYLHQILLSGLWALISENHEPSLSPLCTSLCITCLSLLIVHSPFAASTTSECTWIFLQKIRFGLRSVFRIILFCCILGYPFIPVKLEISVKLLFRKPPLLGQIASSPFSIIHGILPLQHISLFDHTRNHEDKGYAKSY